MINMYQTKDLPNVDLVRERARGKKSKPPSIHRAQNNFLTTETERERETETGRQTDGQTGRQVSRQEDRQTDTSICSWSWSTALLVSINPAPRAAHGTRVPRSVAPGERTDIKTRGSGSVETPRLQTSCQGTHFRPYVYLGSILLAVTGDDDG